MSLLFDENLSPTLPNLLSDLFPHSYHFQHFNYSAMPDVEVWRLAQTQGLCIVSCDQDFYALSFQHGPPPKVIWVQAGPASTHAIEKGLRANKTAIDVFLAHPTEGVLVVAL